MLMSDAEERNDKTQMRTNPFPLLLLTAVGINIISSLNHE